MPESMTSAEWIVAGWGFASGVMLTLCVALPVLWRIKFNYAGMADRARAQRLAQIRDTRAVAALRQAVAAAARRVPDDEPREIAALVPWSQPRAAGPGRHRWELLDADTRSFDKGELARALGLRGAA